MSDDLPRGPLEALRDAISAFRRWTRPLRGKPRYVAPVEKPTPPHPYVALPLGYVVPPPVSVALGVYIHAFHVDVLPRLLDALAAIPIPYSLLLNADTEQKANSIRDLLARRGQVGAEIVVAPNRGRDVGPRLTALAHSYARFEFVLQLHTKRSPHDSHLRGWLDELIEDLLGSPQIVASLLELLARDASLGVVAPRYFHRIRNNRDWGENFQHGSELAARLGVALDPNAPIDFPAGSMFWARVSALRPMLDLGVRLEDFEDETGQVDGTLAHALERLVFIGCENAGFSWCFAGAGAARRRYERPIVVAAPEDIPAAVAAASRPLTSAPQPATEEPSPL